MPRQTLKSAPASAPEVIMVRLTPETFPCAYDRKLKELKSQGLSDEEAIKFLDNEIELEIIYEPNHGLFAVESEAIASCPLRSPYTGTEILEDVT